jgi:hypothetical protein
MANEKCTIGIEVKICLICSLNFSEIATQLYAERSRLIGLNSFIKQMVTESRIYKFYIQLEI